MKRLTLKTGDVFGRLKVIGFSRKNKHGQSLWLCKCACGNEKEILAGSLNSKNTSSCGCLKKEQMVARNTKHGLSLDASGKKKRIYNIWSRMRQRCSDAKCSDFKIYGGRGIKVCTSWESFEYFCQWALSNGYSKDLTIERKDNLKGYSPENCIWIPRNDQAKNKRNNHRITFSGETKILADWCRQFHVESSLLRYRMKSWGVERAFLESSKEVRI